MPNRLEKADSCAVKSAEGPTKRAISCPVEQQVDLNDSDLTNEQRKQVRLLLSKYRDVFSAHKGEIGATSTVRHHIDTGNALPIKQRPYRVPIHKEGFIRHEIQKLLDTVVIRPSSSPWRSNLLLVRKKDGSLRVVTAFRALNAVTIKDTHPLPRIDSIIDSLRGARFFSTFDMTSGYFHIELDEESRAKTAFGTDFSGLYKYVKLPMGMSNAPATFMKLMRLVLAGLPLSHYHCYLDDIIVSSQDFSTHLRHLEAVLVCANMV